MKGFQLSVRIRKENLSCKIIIMTGSHKGDCVEMMATQMVDGWL